MQLPEEEDYDTLSGMIMRKLNEIPRIGKQLVVDNVELSILAASRRAVESVRVKVLDNEPGNSE